MSEFMKRNEYARHQRVSPSAVSKAIQSGRIAKAVVWVNGKFSSIRWRQADELWRCNTDQTEAARTRKQPGPEAPPQHPAPMQTSAPSRLEQMQRARARALDRGLVAWAGTLVQRHGIDAELAVTVLQDLHLVLAAAHAGEMGLDPSQARLLLVGDLQVALAPKLRPALLERVRAAAAAFGETEGHGRETAAE